MTLVVLCELVWVLERGYRYSRIQIAALVRGLLAADDLSIERSELAWQALNAFEEGPADFADYVIGGTGREAGAEATVTFDRRAGLPRSSACWRLELSPSAPGRGAPPE